MLRPVSALAAALALFMPLTARVARAQPVEFTVPPVDQVLDLHGDPAHAQLVIFLAGNQYMVMPALLDAFRKRYPSVQSVFYETLPPGIVLKQVRSGGLRVGNLLISAQPDVLLTGPRGMRTLRRIGKVSAWHSYASNSLAILVHAGNPRDIRSLRDLGRANVRVVMPNPKWEGVAEQIEGAYAKAGGEQLVHTIMIAKLAAGTTILTRIHHRETPLYLLDGRADAGPVWRSEALYQQRIRPLRMVAIPARENVYAQYEAAVASSAPHAAAARAFVTFMQSPQARAILASYGFSPPR
ncbi:MAG TPA: substrate-binding domain-containing protein [Candidatus Baltobacteraceae bacterium]|nr:substrate-binding domain-containing protein [Candidatus Baltobacteraceae bacterium]